MPGGGVALLNAQKALEDIKLEGDAKTGVNIVCRALEAPVKKLAANAGFDGSVVLENIRRAQAEKKNDKIGLNVLTGEYVDMLEEGIVDPAKVTRRAVENAASIAAMVLTTEAMITDKPEPRAGHAARWWHGPDGRHGRLLGRPAGPRTPPDAHTRPGREAGSRAVGGSSLRAGDPCSGMLGGHAGAGASRSRLS